MRTRLFNIAVALGAAGLAATGAMANQPPQNDAPAGGATANGGQSDDIGFMGARLGMGLDAWKALAYPGRNPAEVATACAAGPVSTPGVVVCTYAQRAGSLDLPLSIPLSGTWLVRSPRYDFVGGRLSRIEFRTSIDAFNDLTARFEAKYGPATQTLNDNLTTRDGLNLPRVRKIWRLPAGSIEIVDPTTPPTQLAVRFVGH
ncbi:MAG TPA: hypothetical protein VE309_05430 [Caulobacteraceae bacterium]|jgi:hypothetical protein|nr:hypothetical protein [Caulobacteraceae bacterium]